MGARGGGRTKDFPQGGERPGGLRAEGGGARLWCLGSLLLSLLGPSLCPVGRGGAHPGCPSPATFGKGWRDDSGGTSPFCSPTVWQAHCLPRGDDLAEPSRFPAQWPQPPAGCPPPPPARPRWRPCPGRAGSGESHLGDGGRSSASPHPYPQKPPLYTGSGSGFESCLCHFLAQDASSRKPPWVVPSPPSLHLTPRIPLLFQHPVFICIWP